MLKFNGKNIQTLTKYLNHLDMQCNPTHTFTWKVSMTAPINDYLKKNLEASFMAVSRPSLNE